MQGGIHPDTLCFIFEGSASFSKLAQRTQETGGHQFLSFDEAGVLYKMFNFSEKGTTSEETASLTSIYDGGPLKRDFVNQDFNACIEHVRWAFACCAQLPILRAGFGAQIGSGLTNRVIFALCHQAEEDIHCSMNYYKTSDWTVVEDFVFHVLMTSLVTKAGADLVRTRRSKDDYTLVFKCTPETELYLFVYQIIVKTSSFIRCFCVIGV